MTITTCPHGYRLTTYSDGSTDTECDAGCSAPMVDPAFESPPLSPYWTEYERRVTALEETGDYTRSDAQGIIDLEMRGWKEPTT